MCPLLIKNVFHLTVTREPIFHNKTESDQVPFLPLSSSHHSACSTAHYECEAEHTQWHVVSGNDIRKARQTLLMSHHAIPHKKPYTTHSYE
jgi:hypothetical protein